MKFIAIRANIKDAVSVIEKAVGENTNLPILKNILIEAENNTITFTATNLEIAISHRVAGKVIEDGKITVPLALFSSLIGNIQSDRLNFEKKENNLEIATDNYSAMINGMPADDFPITPKIKNTESYIEIKNVFLKEAIQQVTVASQYSDLRPELNSVLFNFSLESLVLASTDGFRLAEKSIPASAFRYKKERTVQDACAPPDRLEVARIMRDDEVVRIYQDENQVLVQNRPDGDDLAARGRQLP